jgi:hypothetical protein
VRRPWRDPNLLSRTDANPLAVAANEQGPCLDEKPLLLMAVNVERPSMRSFRGLNPLALHVGRRRRVVLDPHPAALHDLGVAHGSEP